MTLRSTPQPPGTPTWLDVACTDLPREAAFWHELMGYEIPPGAPEFGGYTIATARGAYVFGLGPALPGRPRDTAVVHLATDDVMGSIERALTLGGHVVREAVDVPGHGRRAVLADPAGGVFGLWQAGEQVGYERVDEIGFPCWQDCLTTDVDAAAAFYTELFGYTTEPVGHEGALLFRLGDDGHFTMGRADGESTWLTYLLVEDVDRRAMRAVGLRAHVIFAEELRFGRFVHLRTPGGAPFGLFESIDG